MVSLATPSNFIKSWRREGPGRTLTSTFGKIGLPLQGQPNPCAGDQDIAGAG